MQNATGSHRANSVHLSGAVACLLSACLTYWGYRAHAQAACPNILTSAQSWPANTTVYYAFDSSWGTAQPAFASEKSQIVNALNTWSTANTQNGSNVTFQATDSSHPATLTLSLGPTSDPQRFAEFSGTTVNGSITNANISFAINNTLSDGSRMYDANQPGGNTFFAKITDHEIGHGMGMGDVQCDATAANCGWSANTVMDGFCGTNDQGGCQPSTVTSCDNATVSSEPQYAPPPPPPPPPGGCTSNADCTYGGTCEKDGTCTYTFDCSPIIIAVGQSADIQLTSAQDGVWFDLEGSGVRQRVAWTQAGHPVAFLVWDRNHNGIIDNGSELFGNHTLLPNGQVAPNGFNALAIYDGPENGGNGDGIVDSQDAIWSELQLWVDWNHTGFSEQGELYWLEDFGLTQISLNYQSMNRSDHFGNVFRFASPCQLGGKVRFGYDVYFTARPPRNQ